MTPEQTWAIVFPLLAIVCLSILKYSKKLDGDSAFFLLIISIWALMCSVGMILTVLYQ